MYEFDLACSLHLQDWPAGTLGGHQNRGHPMENDNAAVQVVVVIDWITKATKTPSVGFRKNSSKSNSRSNTR
jgi:hypothetical protein